MSLCGVFGKFAAKHKFLSPMFILLYGSSLLILVIYSLFWQRILAKIPLTTAFSNKGITVIWGIIWGALFFGEQITIIKMAAAALIISGIVVITTAEG